MPKGEWNFALVPVPDLTPLEVDPARVVTTDVEIMILRIWFVSLSARTAKLSSFDMEMPVIDENSAEVPIPLTDPALPLPAITETRFADKLYFLRRFDESPNNAKTSFVDNATPQTPETCAAVPTPLM
jgi:hypothetical protein